MWKTEEIEKIKAIYNCTAGTPKEQLLLRDYMMFYGMNCEEPGNYCYSLSYQNVMDMMNGKKHNPFAYIEYNDKIIIYVKEM